MTFVQTVLDLVVTLVLYKGLTYCTDVQKCICSSPPRYANVANKLSMCPGFCTFMLHCISSIIGVQYACCNDRCGIVMNRLNICIFGRLYRRVTILEQCCGKTFVVLETTSNVKGLFKNCTASFYRSIVTSCYR